MLTTYFSLSVAKPIKLVLCLELCNKIAKTLSFTIMSHVDILKRQNFIVKKIMADFESGLIACINDLNRESCNRSHGRTCKRGRASDKSY